ncbi:MAG: hypothetical protein GY851_35565 [bacterium]|nr:hypothetical protein [bacterium]
MTNAERISSMTAAEWTAMADRFQAHRDWLAGEPAISPSGRQFLLASMDVDIRTARRQAEIRGALEAAQAEAEAAAAPAVDRPSGRNEVIKDIRTNLRKRSGKAWSVTGGRGTAWGWLTITAPPRRCGEFGYMTDEDRAELGELLGLGRDTHTQGESVAAGSDYYAEYVDRAAGRTPEKYGTQYWD